MATSCRSVPPTSSRPVNRPTCRCSLDGTRKRTAIAASWRRPNQLRKITLRAIKKLYDERADEVLKLYPGGTAEEVIASGTSLASDRFIAYSTWKWADLHGKTGEKPVYRYFYSRPRPAMNAPTDGSSPASSSQPPPARGAAHSADIEYAMGNLATNKVYAWTPDDYKVSETFQTYFANFVKTGDPNGPGVPPWTPRKSRRCRHGHTHRRRDTRRAGATPRSVSVPRSTVQAEKLIDKQRLMTQGSGS